MSAISSARTPGERPQPAPQRRQAGARSQPSARWWISAAAAVAVVFLLLGFLGEAFAPGPEGPTGSSYATSPGGIAAWAELLSRAGHPVRRLRESLPRARLGASATLVVFGAQRLDSAEARALKSFLEGGGRVVLGGGAPTGALSALLTPAPRWAPAGPRSARPGASLPEVHSVSYVSSAGEGVWTSGPGVRALSAPGGSLLLVKPSGRGTLMMLADPSPVENRMLASADNAQLALNLAGRSGQPVIFAESLHGFGVASGLAAIPERWWLAFAGLLLAGGAWALSRARRLGPPEEPEAPPAPPRSAYVSALATLLLRSSDARKLPEMAREARPDTGARPTQQLEGRR